MGGHFGGTPDLGPQRFGTLGDMFHLYSRSKETHMQKITFLRAKLWKKTASKKKSATGANPRTFVVKVKNVEI